MTTPKFSMGDAIGFGWETMKANIGFFIGVLIAAFLMQVIPEIIVQVTAKDAPVASGLAQIISIVVQMVVTMGLIKIALGFCDNDKAEFADLFSCVPLFFKYLIGAILYGLIVLCGLVLLIVPGIIWSVKFYFFPYFIVDRGLGPIEALKQSSAITQGAKMDLFLFYLLLGGINLIGALCCLVGLFATIPLSMIAVAYAYRILLGPAEAAPLAGTTPDGWPTS